MAMANTKKWTKEAITTLLESNNLAVERAMLALLNMQTQSEQAMGGVHLNNGVGFCGWSSNKGTYYANWVKKGRHLSRHHLDNARRIAKHHAGQLARIANGELEAL